MNLLPKKILFLCFTLLAICSCQSFAQSKKYDSRYAEVKFISAQSQDAVVLQSVGYAPKKEEAVKDAILKALDAVLFAGIAGAPYSYPLIKNEDQAKTNHAKYFTHLYEEEGFETFLQSREVTEFLKTKEKDKHKAKGITIEVEVNYTKLKKDIQEKNINDKFGL